ncbi:MAG: hypothetical protein COZ06_08140 [Armatimonadetes bacterium CG_4_10_14_3_um_filter_66_18]|nr:hypothetical protein [Armatimonadota bacterium]PIU90379.1 MAG: hypothetical protein COS65_25345 [Armatimonadetes bacterium CG06_land_8_20_14_3_00_66_21]PIX43004.1 MAG: hypothetical protein COZ57_20150 [Armatimonadetes bacterium CG_4_8_14_3_um_filter_66_20]PIY50671.1 MAG: hypothetical protein COZ06_08140 [Armatimonadetes bacterium CG_4_10_14_3_um_filter_66_18]PIZ47360.1 MAG: hypothetical protein COY42_08685 [Armatimonadetes bacterium CG_4_10_14_0_8_um_filter_66_14]PJB60610.1 MAG: hypothetica
MGAQNCLRLAMLCVLSVRLAVAAPVETGLVAHWTLDGVANDRTLDATSRRPARIVGASAAEGTVGGCLRFDGKDDFAEVGDLGTFGAVTLAFWMKPGQVERTDDWQGLVSSDAWEEGVFHLPVRNGTIDLYLHLGETRRARLSSPRLRNGVWYHVAVAADRPANNMRLYVNGEVVDSTDLAGLATNFKLKAQVFGRENGGRYFRGALDDVQIYGQALTDRDVRTLCPDATPLRRDLRNLRTGNRIPDEGYCDQPYVVVTKDGNWLCLLTTGRGPEGDRGQHVISTISADKGRTWSEPVPLEPADGPESAYSAPLLTPSGRVYAFYGYNGDNLTSLDGWKGKFRGDMLGWCVTRYSDDSGRTWSERHRLPMRATACDRSNDWQGKHQIWWTIDKPVTHGGHAYFALTKLGRYMLDMGEGWVFHSDNLLTEPDFAKVRWELLPEGEHGIRAPEFGSVQEEHNVVPLSDGSFYCVYRTTTGYPCHSYSRDGGRTWTKPERMTYAPGGRPIKTPRACPKVWRTSNGRYLFWFHNHDGKSFEGRNPAWIAGGLEKDGFLLWSQPEILLYDPDANVRMSYPDLIEQDDRFWVTETQKTVARVHEVEPALLQGVWNQQETRSAATAGLVLNLDEARLGPHEASVPGRLDLRETGGLSVEVWVTFRDLAAGQVVLDSRNEHGAGMALLTTEGGTVRLVLSDGKAKATWECDPGLLTPGKLHHLVATVDAGPRVLTFVVDGVLCDGGSAREYGWGRYADDLGDVTGTGRLRVAPTLTGSLRCVQVYSRPLRTSEAIGNWRSGR